MTRVLRAAKQGLPGIAAVTKPDRIRRVCGSPCPAPCAPAMCAQNQCLATVGAARERLQGVGAAAGEVLGRAADAKVDRREIDPHILRDVRQVGGDDVAPSPGACATAAALSTSSERRAAGRG